MNNTWKVINEAGLQFFGKMNASISHEIKNVLAIVNESAGLLEDLTGMEEQGMPVDSARLRSIAGKIQKQVRRADLIVKNMNTLAHSIDEQEKKVDTGELLAFMAALSKRLASIQGIAFEPAISEKPQEIITNPFLLETMLWRCMDFFMCTAGAEKTIEVSVTANDQGIDIHFTGLQEPGVKQDLSFPGEMEHALASALCGKIELNEGAKKITLSLPLTIHGAEQVR
jgi:light-regulated signal transduction histidine kinase (bacteriophytochrome)